MNTQVSTDEDTRKKYSFYGRLSAAFPSQIIMDTTEICNLACIHCPHPTFKKSEHYSGRCLEFELIKRVIDEVREHGKNITQYIRYTGEGEPLIHPAIFEILAYSVQNSGTIVTLTTNGSLFNDAKIEKLLNTGVNVIDISLDAYNPETYAQIRVNGDLEVTRGNVLKLMAAIRRRGEKTKLVVSYVEQPLNMNETVLFEKYWKEQGADFVVVRRLHSAAGAVSTIAETIRQQGDEVRRPCLYPWERIVINPRGELVFCPQDWVHGAVICDYRTTTLRETWTSDYYLKLREAHLTSQYANHAFCGNCPDWKQTRWPDEGRSYANMIQDFKAKE